MLLLILIVSCSQESKTIVHDENLKTELKKDSSKIEIADLPIKIDSSNYLIHPIGTIVEYGSGLSKMSSYSSRGSYTSYEVSRHNGFSITGTFSNLKFQHIKSNKLKPLTDQIIEITSVTFLESIRKNTGNKFLIYTLRDSDTNKDSKIDFNDVTSLYISNNDGSNFKKLTSKLDQLVNWKVIKEQNRLYFKSISDTNKSGTFDKSDTINYQYVDLTNPKLEVLNYNVMD